MVYTVRRQEAYLLAWVQTFDRLKSKSTEGGN